MSEIALLLQIKTNNVTGTLYKGYGYNNTIGKYSLCRSHSFQISL